MWLEYAHNEFCSDKERAWALKNCLSGEARDTISAIQSHHESAYIMMLRRLDEKYSDISSNIQSVCSEFEKLSPVSDDDVTGLLKFINCIERSYSQLGEVDQIDCISIVQVNKLVCLLPAIQKREWRKLYRSSDIQDQKYPFHLFMSFLESERDIIITDSHSDTQSNKKFSSKKVSSHSSSVNESVESNHGGTTPKSQCLYHDEIECIHSTDECKAFTALPIKEKYDFLRSKHVCFKCFGKHPRNKCTEFKTKCSKCGKPTHHSLLCPKTSDQATSHSSDVEPTQNSADTISYMCDSALDSQNVLLPIQNVKARSNGKVVTATIFFDGGSNATFITKAAAERLNARRLDISVNLGVTTMGNKQQRVNTHPYEVSLYDSSGSVIQVLAYRIDEITGKVPPLDIGLIGKLFSDVDVSQLSRGSNVDIMIGGNLLGLHPGETIATAGEHLKISKGPFGLCIHGSHPELSYTGVQVHMCHVSGGDRVDSVIVRGCASADSAVKCDYPPMENLPFTTGSPSEADKSETAVLMLPGFTDVNSLKLVSKLDILESSTYTGIKSDLAVDQFPQSNPLNLASQDVSEQAMKIRVYGAYDLYNAFPTQAEKLHWSKELSHEVHIQWVKFFDDLFILSYQYYIGRRTVSFQMCVMHLDSGGFELWKSGHELHSSYHMIMPESRSSSLQRIVTSELEFNALILSDSTSGKLDNRSRVGVSFSQQLVTIDVDDSSVDWLTNFLDQPFEPGPQFRQIGRAHV